MTTDKTPKTIQNMAVRTILGKGRQTSSAALEVALGLQPLNLRRKQLAYNYWLQGSQVEKHSTHQAFSGDRCRWGGLLIVQMQRPTGWAGAE